MKNRTEQRGFIWLSVLLLAVLVTMLLVPDRRAKKPADKEIAELAQTAVQESQTNGSHKKAAFSKYSKRQPSSERRTNREFQIPDFSEKNHTAEKLVLDLNTADTLDLQDLHGIGPYFARAIVKYRNLLGGYVDKTQLLEVYGMTEDRYKAIEPNIVVGSGSICKIDINRAPYAELRRHPYIDKYVAKAIVRLREGGEQFRNADDLLKISIIDNETIAKLTPYLEFKNDTVYSGSDGPDA